MPASRKTPWLLCYDISSPRRLQRVYRVVLRYTIPLQHSVFFTYATRKQILSIVKLVEEQIDVRHDDVRVYPLINTDQPLICGRSLIANDVRIFQSPEFNLLEAVQGEPKKYCFK